MKPFEDHVDGLMESLPLRILSGDKPLVRKRVRDSLLALARDQRHVCVEAIQGMGQNIRQEDARQKVMNAPLP